MAMLSFLFGVCAFFASLVLGFGAIWLTIYVSIYLIRVVKALITQSEIPKFQRPKGGEPS